MKTNTQLKTCSSSLLVVNTKEVIIIRHLTAAKITNIKDLKQPVLSEWDEKKKLLFIVDDDIWFNLDGEQYRIISRI